MHKQNLHLTLLNLKERVRQIEIEGDSERKRDRGKCRVGVLRDITCKWGGGGGAESVLALNFSRQYPQILCIDVYLREGKVLGNEKGKGLRCGLCYEQKKEV
jgi:hypothetical protein